MDTEVQRPNPTFITLSAFVNMRHTYLGEVGAAQRSGLEILASPPPTNTLADSFLQTYSSASADEVFTLVGHNRQGAFRFPDQSFIDLTQLGSSGTAPIAVFSCESALYANGSAVGAVPILTYEWAYRAEQIYVASVGSLQGSFTPAVASTLIGEAVNQAAVELRIERAVRVYAPVAIGGGAITVGLAVVQ